VHVGLPAELPFPIFFPLRVRNPFFLDSESGFHWTANPVLTGQ